MSNVRAAKRRTQKDRTFGLWQGYTEDWKKVFSIIPRRTTDGEVSIGTMYRRAIHSYYNDYMGHGPSIEYATEKQLFKSKLLGVK